MATYKGVLRLEGMGEYIASNCIIAYYPPAKYPIH